jgi:hypothetical protein
VLLSAHRKFTPFLQQFKLSLQKAGGYLYFSSQAAEGIFVECEVFIHQKSHMG